MLKTDSKFAQIFNRMTNIPTLPEVASKILQLSEEEANARKLASIIETDPGITAKVLKLVNSAFYSLKNPVANLSHACSLVGARTIKSLVLSVSAMQVFKRRCDGFDQVLFWRNSLATAMVSRRLAEALKVGDNDTVEEAYISGLLHAGGAPLYVQFFPDDYARVLERWDSEDLSLMELEEEAFGAAHPVAGGEIAQHWRFPDRVGLTIKYHRRPAADIDVELDGVVAKLVDIVRLADFWTRRCGLPFVPADAIDESVPAPIPQWCELDEEAVAELIGDLQDLLSGLESVFQSA